jgi:hypothetical protein
MATLDTDPEVVPIYVGTNSLLRRKLMEGSAFILTLDDADGFAAADREVDANQMSMSELCASYPCLLRGATVSPGSQRDCDGTIRVNPRSVFGSESIAQEWWWTEDQITAPIEIGTVTDGAMTRHALRERAVLRWPYGYPPALIVFRLQPYDEVLYA